MVAVWGGEEDKLAAFRRRYPDAKYVKTQEEILEDPSIQLVLSSQIPNERAALGVVMAAGGYPGEVRRGDPIEGLDRIDTDTVKVFHAGTALQDRKVVTTGGRVLCVCALGDTVQRAQARAYDVAGRIHWSKAYMRRDIGYRAVARETAGTATKAAK